MATRALIGYLNPSNSITTTYNHYDGYPENLGVALKKHYATDEKANEVANMGYISYIDPETGDIEANNTDKPVTVGGGDDLVSTLQYFKEEADETDYAYLWSPSAEEWLFAPTAMKMEDFVDAFALGIDPPYEDDMADYDSIDSMEESYVDRWKSFINENTVEQVMSQAMFKLQDEPKEMVDAYKKSLANDIRLNGQESYADFSVEDFIEDYNEYVNDKMDFLKTYNN